LKQVGKVERESVVTQDVTKAYADLETRLVVKRQTEERLRHLLTSRTGKLSEVLEVVVFLVPWLILTALIWRIVVVMRRRSRGRQGP